MTSYNAAMMGLILDSSPPPKPSLKPAEAAPVRAPSRAGIWMRVALAVALLGGSAAVRAWQQGRFDQVRRSGQVCPIRLADLPLELGAWEGHDAELDPRIARGTGAVSLINRVYVHRLTGVTLSLIALYGPAAEVFIHGPENCYPMAGYTLAEGPAIQPIACAGQVAPFAALTYVRGEGGQQERHRVYYAWRYRGWWAPNNFTLKEAVRIPGMFKLHVDRPLGPQERPGDSDPCREFLALLVPEFERRLAAAAPPLAPAAR